MRLTAKLRLVVQVERLPPAKIGKGRGVTPSVAVAESAQVFFAASLCAPKETKVSSQESEKYMTLEPHPAFEMV